MLDHVDASAGCVEVRAERRAHAVRGAVTTEAQPFHQCIETSVGHRPIGIESIGEQVDAAVRNERPQLLQQLHALTGERHPVGAASLHPGGRDLPFGGFQVDLAPFAPGDFGLAIGGQHDEQHRDPGLLVEGVDGIQLAQELTEQAGRKGRVVLLVALAEHANRRHGVVCDQPGVDGVLEDAPQVVAQVPRDLGRSRLNLFQRSGQFEARDLGDRPVLEAGRQVLLDLPVALQDRRRPKVRTRRGIPVGTHRAEAALDAVQFRLGATLSFIASRLDGVNALGDQLARLCVRMPRVGERDLGERPKRLKTFDAVQPELVAPELRAVGLDEDEQAHPCRPACRHVLPAWPT